MWVKWDCSRRLQRRTYGNNQSHLKEKSSKERKHNLLEAQAKAKCQYNLNSFLEKAKNLLRNFKNKR